MGSGGREVEMSHNILEVTCRCGWWQKCDWSFPSITYFLVQSF